MRHEDIKIGQYYIAHFTLDSTQLIQIESQVKYSFIAKIQGGKLPYPHLSSLQLYFPALIERKVTNDMVFIEKCKLEM